MLDPFLVFQKIVDRTFHLFGYSLHRMPPSGYIPIDVLDLVIQDLRRLKPELFFIEIGANDGKHVDPLYRYVSAGQLKGLLVEPQPTMFQRLQANFDGVPGLIFDNAAITEQDGSVKLYAFDSDDAHATMLASLNKDYLKFNGDGVKGKITEVDVPSLSVRSLLRKHDIKAFDILQIDTEGYDYKILVQFLEGGVLPSIIHFENNFLTAVERTDIAKRLISMGYRYLNIGIDMLAYRQMADESFEVRMQGTKLE